MRTLRELAETYERWAADAEALAHQIMVGLDTQRKEIQVKQQESAQTLLEEAERLRQQATRLRETYCLPKAQAPEKDDSLPYSEAAS